MMIVGKQLWRVSVMGRGFKLTQLQVEKLKADGVHGDGAGLYLNVTKGGSKSWLYRYMLAGKAHWMGLGSYPDVPLAEAREKSADCRKLTRQGIDPLREKRQAVSIIRAALAKTISFDDAAAQYIAAKEAEWTNARHIEQWKGNAGNLRPPGHWQSGRVPDRNRSRYARPTADLGGQDRNSNPSSWAH
jgi:hypothetical protein